MTSRTRCRSFAIVALVGALALAGCGSGGGGGGELQYTYAGDVEVDNQTDLSGSWENVYSFVMARAGTEVWTGNLLSDVVYPGEVVFVGTFEEGFYDAEADYEFGTVMFFDVFVGGDATTTFEVY